jgi:hypothetical protein
MNKLVVPFKNRNYRFTFASNWQEIPPNLLPWLGKHIWPMIALYKQLMQSIDEKSYLKSLKLDEELQTYRIQVLKKLCNIGWWPYSKRNRAFFSLLGDELAEILLYTNFIFKKIELKKPFESIRFRFKTYYLPTENLDNITAGEFHFAEKAFVQAISGDKAALAQLMAILWRPRGKGPQHDRTHHKFTGDIRTPFNPHTIESREGLFAYLPGNYSYPTLLWFAGCRAAIIENYPEIFTGTDQGGSEDGWLDIFRALARDPLKFEEVANKKLHFLLWELTKMDQDRRKKELQTLNETA